MDSGFALLKEISI